MIIVVAALRFETKEARDAAVAATADVQLATREEEAGCLDYCFAPDPSVPTRIQVYELWEDSDSLAAHFQHPNYHKMVEVLHGAGIVESINQAHLVAASEPVYGPNGEKKPVLCGYLSHEQDYRSARPRRTRSWVWSGRKIRSGTRKGQ